MSSKIEHENLELAWLETLQRVEAAEHDRAEIEHAIGMLQAAKNLSRTPVIVGASERKLTKDRSTGRWSFKPIGSAKEAVKI